MQYAVSTEKRPGPRGDVFTWVVEAWADKDNQYLGRITRFNTEDQARDYIAVQERISVEIVRKDKPFEHDFKVLINGEHRATFRSRRRYHQTGYDLEGCDGESCAAYELRYIDSVQANFELLVRIAIAAGKVPTVAQIERSATIAQAERENRERDTQIAAHRAQVRRNVLMVALSNYPTLAAPDAEHLEMAARMLREVER